MWLLFTQSLMGESQWGTLSIGEFLGEFHW